MEPHGEGMVQGLCSTFGVRILWGGKQLRTLFQLCPWHSYGFPNHFLNNYLQANEKMRVVCILFSLMPIVLTVSASGARGMAGLPCDSGSGARGWWLFRRAGDYSGDQARAFPLHMWKFGKPPPPWTALGLGAAVGEGPLSNLVCVSAVVWGFTAAL